MKSKRLKHTLPLLTALLLAAQAALPATEPAAAPRASGFPATMSELAQPARRSPRAPKYEDICFSPRTTAAGGRDVVEVAKAFHATRIEWLYVHEADGSVLGKLRDLGISLGLAITHPRDTTEHHSGPVGFSARPQYYTKGRVLDIDGKVLDGRSSMHDPATAELMKENLRLCAKFGAERVQRDEPEWSYRDWDFNPHALSQFNAWLDARVPAPTLAELGVDNPARFDLKAYIRSHEDGKTVPTELKKLWEDFRRETLLAWYRDLRRWTAEIAGPGVEWSANYSSFVQFTPERLWSDYAVTELQPSGGQFGIGDPWSLYRKAQISRELGKALVVTLGSHDIEENKIMIGLTYAMGLHMICPFAVYMKDKPRKFDDPKLYADVYDFVHRWGKRYLAGYEEAFALGNGITHPLTRAGIAPLALEDRADSVYAFVRARPGQPDAPVVIHLVNWNRRARDKIALTLDPDRFFPDRGLKLTLLRPSQEPRVLSEGFQARVELPSPAPWQIVIAEPASPTAAKVWAPRSRPRTSAFSTNAMPRCAVERREPSFTSPPMAVIPPGNRRVMSALSNSRRIPRSKPVPSPAARPARYPSSCSRNNPPTISPPSPAPCPAWLTSCAVA